MKKKLFRKAASVLAAGVMVFAMSAAVFATIPSAYSPDANITVGKTLTAKQAGVWPDTVAFTFNLEAVSYTAGPDTTNPAYTAYTKANLPMPVAGTANTAAALNGDGAMAETITVSGFDRANTGTSQTISVTTGNATYTQAGVYTYKVNEIIPATQEPGVTYDSSVYYVNVYVTNVLNDNGTPYLNTATGLPYVNVSNITAYKGTNGATDPTAPDFGGVAAGASTTDAKIGIMSPVTTDGAARNISYPFTNDYTTTDLTVTKKVTGTMADINKEFSFTLGLTNGLGAADTRNYDYQVYSMGADEAKGGTDDVVVTTTGKSGTLTDGGTFTLKHNEYIVITGLAAGEIATVTETGATDYITTIVSQNGAAADAAVTAKTVGAKTLSTVTGEINQQDFVNNKEAVTPTGIVLEIIPFVLIVSAAGVALFFMLRKRKRSAQ